MIELKGTQANITLKSPTVVGGSVDLSNYYTKDETNALIPDVSGFITGSEADTKISTAVSLAEERVDFKLGSYALKTEIPDVSGFITEIPSEYVTESELAAKGYLTEHQSLDGYATKAELNEAIAGISQGEHNFIINIVKQSDKYTCDKTFTEIQTAFESDKMLFVDFMEFGIGIHYIYLYSTNYTVSNKKRFIFYNASKNTSGINIIRIYEDGVIEEYINVFAKTTDIPDVSGFQTEAQVIALINANLPPSGEEVSY